MAHTNYCGCDNGGSAAKYQDAKYGKGNRVVTVNKGGDLLCTVCGKANGRMAKLVEKEVEAKK